MNEIKREILASAVSPMIVQEGSAASRRYLFSHDFIGFSGHFPGYPILPAFVQIMMACTLAEELLGRNLELALIEKAKFLIEIKPEQEILVRIRESIIGEMPRCEAHLIVNDDVAAYFRMSFEEEEGGHALKNRGVLQLC